MNLEINSISEEEFNTSVKIRFKNILDGFNQYNSKTLNANDNYSFEENEKYFIGFIEEVYKFNSSKGRESSCYVDFYLKDLSNSEYIDLLKGLDFEDREQLENIRNTNLLNTQYFEVKDVSVIKLLTKMCTRELFFITFYFTEIPLTIWGNYNLNFPIFYENEEVISEYIDIIEKYGLNMK